MADTAKKRRSFVILDPKVDACVIDGKSRRRVSGVKIINPFGLLVETKSDGWNPLADLEPEATGEPQ